MTKHLWSVNQLTVRRVHDEDVDPLATFSCSLGRPWEDEVQDEVRANLARRYLGARDGDLDARMLVTFGPSGEILAVAAHRVEPVVATLPNLDIVDLRPTYLEVIAVGLDARRTSVDLADGRPTLTFGEFMYEATLNDVRQRPKRDPLIFGRVDRRHKVSLAFCERVGLTVERPNQDQRYVQRWGDV